MRSFLPILTVVSLSCRYFGVKVKSDLWISTSGMSFIFNFIPVSPIVPEACTRSYCSFSMYDNRPAICMSALMVPFSSISSNGYTCFIIPKLSTPFASARKSGSLTGVFTSAVRLKGLPASRKLNGWMLTVVRSMAPPGFLTSAWMFIWSTPAGREG